MQQRLGKMHDTIKQWITPPSEEIQKYIAELKSASTCKSTTQQHLLSHIGRMRHMASIYRQLMAFARNLEVWAYSVKQLAHHIRMTCRLKNDPKLAIWSIKRTAEYGISFNQFLKSMEHPRYNAVYRGSSKHWFREIWYISSMLETIL